MSNYVSNNIDISQLNVILLEIQADQTISMINDKGCAILECTKENIIGKNWFETFLPQDTRKKVKAFFYQLISGNTVADEYNENEIITLSGKRRLIGWHNSLQYDNYGTIISTLSIGEDITDKIHTQAFLQNERDKALLYFDITDAIMMVTDSNQHIIKINRKGCYLFGQHEKELLNKPLKHFFSDTSMQILQARFIEAANNPNLTSFYSEDELLTKAHTHHLIAWHHKFLLNETKQITGIISSGIDISNQKRAENLLRIQRDLTVLLSSFSSNVDDLFNSFMEIIISIYGIDQIGLYLFDKDKEKLILKSIKPPVDELGIISFNNAAHQDYFELLLSGQTIHLFQETLKQPFPNDKIKNITIIPIIINNRLLAVLNIASTHFDHFEDDLFNTLQSLGNQLGNTVTQINSRLALRQSEALNRNILENIGIGMILLDRDYRVVTINRQMRIWFPGFDINSHPLHHDFFKQEKESIGLSPGMRSFQTGQRHETVIASGEQDQHKRYFKIVSSPIFNDNKSEIIGVVELIEDITQKIKLDDAMQSMHLRTSQILRSIPSILIGINNQNLVSEWNSAAEKAFNITKAEAFDQPFDTLPLPWENHDKILAFREKMSNNHKIGFPGIKYKRQDGSAGLLDITITRMIGTGNLSLEFLLIANDITDNKVI